MRHTARQWRCCPAAERGPPAQELVHFAAVVNLAVGISAWLLMCAIIVACVCA